MAKLAGVQNFRDFGGYATVSGRRLHQGRLFRSAHLADATTEDIATIAALGLAAIVDLRRAEERRRFPTGNWSAACQIITSDIGEADDPWHGFLRSSDLSAASFRRYLIDFYQAAPFEPRHIDLYTRYFAMLATGSGPVLVHCMAGKDRTGLIVALTHALTGVHRDYILAEFLRTNLHWPYEIHGAAITHGIAAAAGRKPDEAAVRAAMELEAAYLDGAFDAIDAGSGSLDAYFDKVLGLTPEARTAITARLTENTHFAN